MNKKLVAGGIAGVLATVGLSVGGALFAVGAFAPPVVAELDAEGEDAPGEPAAALPTFYHPIQPEFVVNLAAPSRAKFLMLELAVATHAEDQLAELEDHMPELRNDLLMLFSEVDAAALGTGEGKRALRESVRERVDALLQKHGEGPPIEDVYLTRFVMQ